MDRKIKSVHGVLLGVFSLFVLTAPLVFSAEPERIIPPTLSKENSLLSSHYPQLSFDGRLVVFESAAALVPSDNNKIQDVYIYDRDEKTFLRVPAKESSRSNGGGRFSRNANQVAFHSMSKEDLKKNIRRLSDILIYDRQSGKITAITNSSPSTEGESLFPQFSGDGHRLVFTSNTSGLIPGVTSLVRQIFLFDLETNAIQILSKNSWGEPANRICADPKMSDDGNSVIFRSAATNLVPGMPPESLATHLYWIETPESSPRRLSSPQFGFDDTKLLVGAYDIDSSGRLVVFEGRKKDVTDPWASLETVNLYILDTSTTSIQKLTTGIFSGRSQHPSLSGDGRFVSFVLKPQRKNPKDAGGVVVYDRLKKRWARLSSGVCRAPVISKDGCTVAFEMTEVKKISKRSSKKVSSIFVAKNPFVKE